MFSRELSLWVAAAGTSEVDHPAVAAFHAYLKREFAAGVGPSGYLAALADQAFAWVSGGRRRPENYAALVNQLSGLTAFLANESPPESVEITGAAQALQRRRGDLGLPLMPQKRRHFCHIRGDEIIGGSPTLIVTILQLDKVGHFLRDPAILLLGEPGVGKTSFARYLHERSNRRKGPFIRASGAGTPSDPGLVRGTWAGYGKHHGLQGMPASGAAGLLERASGGTLLIDEVDAAPLELQIILLAALEGHPLQRIGVGEVTTDVRFIFASNQDLASRAKLGEFRRDLLDRIAAKIAIPPLRDRPGDIPQLARFFADASGVRTEIDDRAMLALVRHHWPDNVRGLRLAIEGGIASARQRLALGARQRASKAGTLVLDVASLEGCGASVPEGDVDIWHEMKRLAENEGFTGGYGLGARVAEMMGLSESEVSRQLGE